MKDLIIIGNGSFSELLYYYLTEYSDYEVAAFSVNQKYILSDSNTFHGLPILPMENLQDIFPPDRYDVILGVGYSKMNEVRKRLYSDCKQKGYSIASYIHPTAYVSRGTVLGEGNIILENSLIKPFATIGDGNIIWCDVKISHNNIIGDFNTLSGNVSLSGNVTINNQCFLGNSCVVHDGCTLANYTLAGAGAIVSMNTNPYDVLVPARSIVLKGKRSTDFMR